MKRNLIFLVLLFNTLFLFSQKQDTVPAKTKKGWSFGAIPVIGYDSDIGFQYGVLGNIYHYGDGTIYPDFKHSIYLEFSHTTGGSGINMINYDSGVLFDGIRVTGDFSYLTEQTLDFFGFNGYEAEYDPAYVDRDDPEYITSVYYKYGRRLFRLTGDFQYNFDNTDLWLLAGFGTYYSKIATVDIDRLNKHKDEDEKLPDVNTLYDNYIEWGIIPESEKDGGMTGMLKFGFIYDSRDNEASPMHGMWSEMFIQYAPSFLGTNSSYAQFNITHRQYFTLIKDKMSFAYRLAYQTNIGGEMPFYMLPFIFYGNRATRDGLGGARTLRGVIRNRVVGEGVAYGNFEVRWKFFETTLWRQDIYLALSPFTDMGIVTKKYKFSTENVPDDVNIIADKEKLHISYGMSFNFALNHNFILCFNYGMAADKRDGSSGMYITVGYLF
jgi:hypothetical protein